MNSTWWFVALLAVCAGYCTMLFFAGAGLVAWIMDRKRRRG